MAAEGPFDYHIEILGINWNRSDTTDNGLMTAGRDLPWLQDTNEDNVQSSWGAQYRDVVILGPDNSKMEFLDPVSGQVVDAFNLTAYDLGQELNRTRLKDILQTVAVLLDTDADKVSDYWEVEMFSGDLSSGPSSNHDGDQASELLEYAHASDAADAGSLPAFQISTLEDRGQVYLTITFRRRLGLQGGLSYGIEFSEDLVSWSSGSSAVIEALALNPYDGTGTEFVTYRAVRPLTSLNGMGYLRVQCHLP